MQREIVELSEIRVVGLSARTSNLNEISIETAKIPKVAEEYLFDSVAEKLSHRLNPGVTISLYADYESNHTGEYTYIIGEKVDSFEDQDGHYITHTIPAQKYMKFTVGPDLMPKVIIDAWKAIWNMTDEELGGKRNYLADFEVYDERSHNPESVVMDIYIGIK
ncbi:MAG: AraC family transcriptional regulator [Alphaproteobacteria bacterium]|nr:AraC family transcriptional regulator [Alphaproteobacteria bacterium]OJV16039.1 MAG: AraC family transcriptional regulator [Alphaproteobacteria bacterium 33-17]